MRGLQSVLRLPNFDGNAGSPLEIAELVENRQDRLRQLSSTVYSLKGVQIMTNTLVKRIILSRERSTTYATGIELTDSSVISAEKEIIVSAGAYRTPQLLQLSGIGGEHELEPQGIFQVV